MSGKKTIQRYGRIAVLLVALFVAGCTPAAAPEAKDVPVLITEPFTPTAEIFNPLDPSPTPSVSTLPLTCQVTDLKVYINREWGYCFAYPAQYSLDEDRKSEGRVSLYGPAIDENADPIRISLEVKVQPVPEDSDQVRLVDAYLAQFRNVPLTITRGPWLLGSIPAEKLEPVPGLLSSRMVMALHNNLLFALQFHPADIDYAKQSLDDLTQTVSGSFAFLEGTPMVIPHRETVSWSEFGKTISLTYDSSLAPWVEAQTVPAVPMSNQILFAESRPMYAQFRFSGYQGGRLYQLPLLPVENHIPQVMLFRTADFPGYGDDSATGFIRQWQSLQELFQTGVDPSLCAQPVSGEFTLPFLPWLNYHQTFCSQPQILAFPGGRGIRYLTFYSQGPDPVLDQQVFYTFQGVTDDGQFYVSAVFPVETGIFPTEPVPCPKCSEPDYNPFPEWQALLGEQLTQLNAQDTEKFAPSLTTLDELIRSIQIIDKH
jgi:hypothetical protein